ncbi:uncharacterized protein LOC136041100 [Artemia franciscana]|uniref:uncharacterized protein LOC136041100 n=1 Tax=Artemia franciscana TaxID=6661 RepID=UPI0032DA6AFF
MSVHKPHVVVITESLPKNCAHPEAYFQQVEGYTLLVNTNYKRGIFVYVHSLLKYTEVNDLLVLSISECLVVDVKFPRSTNSIRIVVVYRSPSVNELSPNNNANLLQYLHNVSTVSSRVLLPTRFRDDSNPSVLDLVITKSPDDVNNIEILPPLGKSDHTVLKLSLKFSGDDSTPQKQTLKYNYTKGDYDSVRNFILSLCITEQLRENKYNVNEVFELIHEALVVGQNKFIPTIVYSQFYKNRQTLPREILQAISEKNYRWRQYIKIRSTESWIRYKRARNRATRLLRSNCEALESSIIASARSSPKRLWKYIRKNKTSQSPSSTSFTDHEIQTNIDDDNEKAEHFNKLFLSVFTRPHSETPIDPNFSTNFTIDFDDSDFDDQQVFEVLKHLDTNKSPDIHEFSNYMIRELATVLTEPLTYLYTLCLASGTCPMAWKKAIIKPL